jgi:hypothetical protein
MTVILYYSRLNHRSIVLQFEIKFLRKTFGPTKEDNGSWRIATKKELDELIKH